MPSRSAARDREQVVAWALAPLHQLVAVYFSVFVCMGIGMGLGALLEAVWPRV